MKAVLQSYRNGKLIVADVPPPSLRPGGVLVQNAVSLVSAGTERMMVELARKSILGKIRQRPDWVHQVLGKVRQNGILSTLQAVRHRLDDPVPLGYSSAGTVIAVGEGIEDLRIGDRVACAGAGYANHAGVVFIPQNLAVRIPGELDFESAAFATLGAIALQGMRLAEVQLGETVVVIGLGLVGLLALQLARAAGCQVIGLDINPARTQRAKALGITAVANDASGLLSIVQQLTENQGADAVLVTAATKSNEPLIQAGKVARDKAVVAVIGVVGMEIPRKIYYEKELTLRVSRSYGPGRYDPAYEEKGHSYPIGYVRWTEKRNLQAFVQQVAQGQVAVKPLITHRFPVQEAFRAYDLITREGPEDFLGVLLTYPPAQDEQHPIHFKKPTGGPGAELSVPEKEAEPQDPSPLTVGLLGAGQFATSILLPAMKKVANIELAGVCTAQGIHAAHAARKFGFSLATTVEGEIVNHPDIEAIVVATRHHLHARQVIAALQAGKDVFVEKPLCLNETELKEIITTYYSQVKKRETMPIWMVGYNRRFSGLAGRLQAFCKEIHEPLVLHYQVNAGYIPPDHWVHDPEQGGGRIIGEVCHFVDLLIFLCGAIPRRVWARALPNKGLYRNDNLVITLEFTNESLGTITYVANGDKAFPKEKLEIYGGGRVAVLHNFRRLELWRNGRRRVERSWWGQDKGHPGEWEAFYNASRMSRHLPIPIEEIVATSLTTFGISKAISDSVPVKIYPNEILAAL